MSFVEILKVIVLGIVEGFTEWLPISSTSHMMLVNAMIRLDQPDEYYKVFQVVIQLGAILAVVTRFFHKLWPFARSRKTGRVGLLPSRIDLWIKIVAACVPAGVLGILFDDIIDEHLYTGLVVGLMLILYGIFFILVEKRNEGRSFAINTLGELDLRTAVYIGLFQCLALIPGTSRSGATIIGAMLLGVARVPATEFTFFLAVPVMLGASLLKLIKYGLAFSGVQIFYLLLAMAVAYAVSMYCIGFMLRYLTRMAGKKLLKLFGGRLRFLGIGGAKLDGGAERFLLEAKVPYAIGYGLTETAPLLAGAAPSQVRLGSTGPQAPGVELRLENVNPETRQGEIVARTPSAMVGYFKNPEATKEAFTADGWFRTGDLGEFDKDGWLYIKGRLKNMIVGPGGENIYPEDIETVLNSHVCIADSIVTEQEGRLIALVHFNREEIESMIDDWREEWESKKEAWEAKTEQLKKEIMDFVNAKVNRFSRISEVVEEKEDFIKTPTQKIKRFLYNKSKKEGKTPDQPATGK